MDDELLPVTQSRLPSAGTEFVDLQSDIQTNRDPLDQFSYQQYYDDEDYHYDSIIAEDVIVWTEIIVVIILCGVISTFGLFANVINVLVYKRMNVLANSSNASLLVLAISDIGSLLPLLGNSINYAIFYTNEDTSPFLSPLDVTEIFFLWPHIMFVQISSWITVYIAFERCLSVTIPLKIKSIFSGQRSLFVVSAIAVGMTLSFLPIYATIRIGEQTEYDTNASKLIFGGNDVHFEIVGVSSFVQSIILRILAVAIVFICTQITVYKLNVATKWRIGIRANKGDQSTSTATLTSNKTSPETTASSSSPSFATTTTTTTTTTTANTTPAVRSEAKSNERRTVKVITAISTIFLLCNLPEIVGILILLLMEYLHGLSPWDNLNHFITCIQFLFESINAAINIFVYYNMSRNYKAEFRRLFRMDELK